MGVVTPPPPYTQLQITHAIEENLCRTCRTWSDESDLSDRSDKRVYRILGGNAEGVTPVPIPNTEVKPLRADGTARAAVWESRSPPGTLYKSPASFIVKRGFCASGRDTLYENILSTQLHLLLPERRILSSSSSL